MKKLLGIIIILNIGTILLGGITKNVESSKVSYKYGDVKDKLIRFHVLANSNTDRDQNLKLMVKDQVIEYMEPILKESKSLEESRKLLLENKKRIQEIAEEIVQNEGYDYKVKIELKKENFPEKVYGNIILPQGEYEAFRILLGDYKGENWWCVMFPPLCFTDVTRGEVAYEETEREMEKTLGSDITVEKEQEIEYSFKFLEVIDKIFK